MARFAILLWQKIRIRAIFNVTNDQILINPSDHTARSRRNYTIYSVEMGGHRAKFVAVAQLVERLLPTSAVRGSNLLIGKFNLLSTVVKLN